MESLEVMPLSFSLEVISGDAIATSLPGTPLSALKSWKSLGTGLGKSWQILAILGKFLDLGMQGQYTAVHINIALYDVFRHMNITLFLYLLLQLNSTFAFEHNILVSSMFIFLKSSFCHFVDVLDFNKHKWILSSVLAVSKPSHFLFFLRVMALVTESWRPVFLS